MMILTIQQHMPREADRHKRVPRYLQSAALLSCETSLRLLR
jgi:hypothetical protein